MPDTSKSTGWEKARQIGSRLVFVILSTTIMVFFSEKAYWYSQGFVLGELILFYAFPVYAILWAVERFRVRSMPALILVAALFAFLIEGVLTPVIYEAGLLDPVMPAYFIGWHGLLSVVFGWYLLRKWLVHAQWRRILAGSALFGLFWGIWSITFWLPENAAEWEQLVEAGEVAPGGTLWTVPEFATYVFFFTLMLGTSHWLLGRGIWQTQFNLSKAEKWILTLVLVALFVTLVLPVLPLAIVKLAVMLAIIYLALRLNRSREAEGTLLTELGGSVRFLPLLGLLPMPALATAVYAIASNIQSSEDLIRTLQESIPPLQALVGAAVFLWALASTLRSRAKPPELAASRLV
ncbi:MAG: hypothetical protein BMS9Abin28_0774 [Anaerolineae bacterium]|nr:MAG: hypothetical protein BMS9Abin28_0774 [Anaerolineae bacterium]